MAHVGQQVPLQLGGLLHLAGHVVEVPGQLVELVRTAGGLHPHVVVAAGHLPGGPAQLGQRPGKPPAEHPGRDHRHRQQPQAHGGQQLIQHHGGLGHLGHAGGQDHGIAPVPRQAAHHHLAAVAVFVLHDLVDLVLFKHLAAQIDHLGGVPLGLAGHPEGAGVGVQQAGIEMLDVGDAAQGIVGHVHAAALKVQRAVHDLPIDAAPELVVHLQPPQVAVADGGLGRVDAAGQGFHPGHQIPVDVVLVQRLQKTGHQQPDQQQGQRGHGAEEKQQLGAHTQRAALRFAAGHRGTHLAAPGSNL